MYSISFSGSSSVLGMSIYEERVLMPGGLDGLEVAEGRSLFGGVETCSDLGGVEERGMPEVLLAANESSARALFF